MLLREADVDSSNVLEGLEIPREVVLFDELISEIYLLFVPNLLCLGVNHAPQLLELAELRLIALLLLHEIIIGGRYCYKGGCLLRVSKADSKRIIE